MNKIIVQPGQTLADIAVQQFNSVQALSAIAALNGVGLTDEIEPGTVLALPDVKVSREKVQPVNIRNAPKAAFVQPGQTLADIAVQYFNSVQALSAIAALNGVGLTDEIEPGTVLLLPDLKADRENRQQIQRKPSVRTAIVQPGQTLPDIAIQYCGSLKSWAEISLLNHLKLTSIIYPGQILVLPEPTDHRVQQYYFQGGYFPASTGSKDISEGVSYWGIEYDFTVQ
jgi:nucleoid-associated protein YgaU